MFRVFVKFNVKRTKTSTCFIHTFCMRKSNIDPLTLCLIQMLMVHKTTCLPCLAFSKLIDDAKCYVFMLNFTEEHQVFHRFFKWRNQRFAKCVCVCDDKRTMADFPTSGEQPIDVALKDVHYTQKSPHMVNGFVDLYMQWVLHTTFQPILFSVLRLNV